MSVIRITQHDGAKWRKLPLSHIQEGDEIIVGGRFKIHVNGELIYSDGGYEVNRTGKEGT